MAATLGFDEGLEHAKGLLPALCRQPHFYRRKSRQFPNVRARRKCLFAGAGNDRGADGRVFLNALERVPQFRDHRARERIELVRTIDGDQCNPGRIRLK